MAGRTRQHHACVRPARVPVTPRAMSGPKLHLVVNHLPVLLLLAGSVAVVAALALRRLVAWRLGTLALVLAALLFYPVELTGDAASDVAVTRWYTSNDTIAAHGEAAHRALYVVLLAGVAAGYGWWRKRRLERWEGRSVPGWVQGAVAVTALAATAATWYAAWLGGTITHDNAWLARPTMPPVDSIPVKLAPGALARPAGG